MEDTYKRGKIYKTAVFMILDMILVLIFTWIWFEYIQNDNWEHWTQSAGYTVYITMVFGVYYYIYDTNWHRIKNGSSKS